MWNEEFASNIPNNDSFCDQRFAQYQCLHIFTWRNKSLRHERKELFPQNLTVNLSKSEFGCTHVTYLGHVIDLGQVVPVDVKDQTIMAFAVPTDKKALTINKLAQEEREFCLQRIWPKGI